MADEMRVQARVRFTVDVWESGPWGGNDTMEHVKQAAVAGATETLGRLLDPLQSHESRAHWARLVTAGEFVSVEIIPEKKKRG